MNATDTGWLPREGRMLLAAAAVLFLAGWVKGINLLMLLAYLMAALMVVNLIVALRQLRRVRARRAPLRPLFAGTPGTWEVELTGGARPSSGWRIEDVGPHHHLSWFIDRLDARQMMRLRAEAVLPKRGPYSMKPLTAYCLHPFGLVRWKQAVGPAEEVVVLPALGQLDVAVFRRWLERTARGDGRLRHLARPSMIHQDDLHGLRPFRPGDSPRWIHWRTSARRNEKIVREFERASGQSLIVVVDPIVPDGVASADDPRFEALVSLAATICWEWGQHNNDQMFLLIADKDPVVHAGACTRDRALAMLRSLARVAPGLMSPAEAALAAVSRRVLPDAPVVILSLRDRSPLHDRLAAATTRPVVSLDPKRAGEFYRPPGAPVRAPAAAPMELAR